MRQSKWIAIFFFSGWIIIISSSTGCQSGKPVPDHMQIVLTDNFRDTCIVLKNEKGDTLSFYRNIEIIENSFSDTLNIGFSTVLPGETGVVFLAQTDTSRSSALNADAAYRKHIFETDSPEAKTKFLCVYRSVGYDLNGRNSLTLKLVINK